MEIPTILVYVIILGIGIAFIVSSVLLWFTGVNLALGNIRMALSFAMGFLLLFAVAVVMLHDAWVAILEAPLWVLGGFATAKRKNRPVRLSRDVAPAQESTDLEGM